MRLVCPNCSVQYEVDDSAIPEAGRNVQCANCNNTWFQEPATAAKSKPKPKDLSPGRRALRKTPVTGQSAQAPSQPQAATPQQAATPPQAATPQQAARQPQVPILPNIPSRPNVPSPPQAASPSQDPSPEQILDAEAAQQDDQDTGPRAGIATADKHPVPPAVDQSVLNILRKEAELEAEARRSNSAGTAQPPSNVNADFTPEPRDQPAESDSLEKRARLVRSRMNGKRKRERERQPNISADQTESYDDDDNIAVAPKRVAASAGRGKLPDIEQLHSSLRSAQDKSRPAPDAGTFAGPERRDAGRYGFYLASFIALFMLAGYQLSDQIVSVAPQSEQYVVVYVEQVNQARVWLDGFVANINVAAKNLMEQYL